MFAGNDGIQGKEARLNIEIRENLLKHDLKGHEIRYIRKK
jgi:hypothetical protein